MTAIERTIKETHRGRFHPEWASFIGNLRAQWQTVTEWSNLAKYFLDPLFWAALGKAKNGKTAI